jgi:DNA-binding CsgD family transcriptional regulator
MALTGTREELSTFAVPVSLPLDAEQEHPKVAEMAFLALSHTAIEHRLYEVMLNETLAVRRAIDNFSVRRLLALSGLRSYGSVRRGCSGLLRKLSIETLEQTESRGGALYRVFNPNQIFARRQAAGLAPYPDQLKTYAGNRAFRRLIQRVVGRDDLSRREAFVVLCCAEGLSNAEIGQRLRISEQTVKSHLRQIFDKFQVRRRTELVSQLLTQRSRRQKNGSRKSQAHSGDSTRANGHPTRDTAGLIGDTGELSRDGTCVEN